jgi:hypothetical protein
MRKGQTAKGGPGNTGSGIPAGCALYSELLEIFLFLIITAG